MESLYQLSIHAYYAGEPAAGLRACEKFLRLPDITADREATVRTNRTWYTPKLSDLLPIRYARLDIPGVNPGWTQFNPSIIATETGWLLNVRSSNYRIVNWRNVIPSEDGAFFRTKNLLVECSGDFSILRIEQLQPEYPKTLFTVDGLEDIRFNTLPSNEIRLSATLRNMAPHDGTCRLGIGLLGENGNVTGLRVPSTVSGIHEKNWMPISGQDRWLYSCSYGGHVATVALWNGQWMITQHASAPALARGFRGGSQLIPVTYLGRPCWLAVIHEVAWLANHRVYEHRFVLFDEAADFAITHVSLPFVFHTKRGIEFCAGMAERDGELALTFGVHDEEAWIARVSTANVLNLLGEV